MKLKLIALLPLIISLTSCFGIDTNIVINANGSGTISIEYRIASSLDELGRLDGNERWNTIPAGRADFERTLDRIPDIRLLSFSSSAEGRNTIFNVRMEFSGILGLLGFLDAYGSLASYSSISGNKLVLTLSAGAESIDRNLELLLRELFNGYFVQFSFSLPGEGSLVLLEQNGNIIPPNDPVIQQGEIVSSGRRVSFSLPAYNVLRAENGLNLELNWQ